MGKRLKEASGGRATVIQDEDGFLLQRTPDASPALGSDYYTNWVDIKNGIKNDAEVGDAISKRHTRNTDTKFANGYGQEELEHLSRTSITSDGWQEPSGGLIFDGYDDEVDLRDYPGVFGFQILAELTGTNNRPLAILGTDLTVNIASGVITLGAGFTNATIYVNGVNTNSVQAGYNDIIVLADEFDISGGKLGTDGVSFGKFTCIGFRTFNKTLTEEEIKKLYNNGLPSKVPFELQGANNTPIYQSDFSAGVDSWVEGEVTLTGNADGISDGTTSKDDVLQVACSTNNTYHYAQKSLPFAQSKYVKLEFDYYIPSTADNITRIVVGNAIADSDVIEGSRHATTKGNWAHHSFIFKLDLSSPRNVRFWGSNDAFTTFAGTANDIYYLKNVKATAVGAVLDLKPENAGSNGWLDASGNGLNGITIGGPVARRHRRDYGESNVVSYTMTNTVKVGDLVSKIIITNTDSVNDAANLEIKNGSDVWISNENIPANSTKVFVVNKLSIDEDLVFSIDSAVDKLKITVINEEVA